MNDPAIATFQQALRGRLVHPTDADYDAVRALYNGMIDKRPRLIARAVDAGDLAAAVGGALARAVLGDRASRPITLARDYALPAWTTPDTTVLCASYSGDTEETLAAYERGATILRVHDVREHVEALTAARAVYT